MASIEITLVTLKIEYNTNEPIKQLINFLRIDINSVLLVDSFQPFSNLFETMFWI